MDINYIYNIHIYERSKISAKITACRAVGGGVFDSGRVLLNNIIHNAIVIKHYIDDATPALHQCSVAIVLNHGHCVCEFNIVFRKCDIATVYIYRYTFCIQL